MHILSNLIEFPPVEESDSYGVLALGGDLFPDRLTLAYQSGIFPWYEDGEPIIWWSPPKRMVLFPSEIKISKSMRAIINKNTFTITFNERFKEVIANCAQIKRDGQRGTWITDEMQHALSQLPLELRETLLLVVVGELTHQEVADMLETPLGTILSRVSRARRRLRELLVTAKY